MKKQIWSILTVMGLSLSAIAYPLSQAEAVAPKTIKVHFINVGQGDGIYIKAPNGEDILIDAGNKDGSDVVDYLKKQKVDDIEIMISTHPDADHLGGLDEVLSAFKVESVYAPKVSHTTQAYKEFLLAVQREKLKINTVTKGTTLKIKDVKAVFVAPVKAYNVSDLNNWSAVLHVTYNKNSFLFTGDAEAQSETDMVNSKQNIRADVLKAGHHGAKESTNTNFLNAVKPKYAIISVGAKNSYGHPTPSALDRLKKAKVTVYRTDQKGHIVMTSDGTKITIQTEKK